MGKKGGGGQGGFSDVDTPLVRIKKSMAKNKHVSEENILEIDKDGRNMFKIEQWRNFCDLYNIKMELRKNEYLAMFLAITGDKYTWKTKSRTLTMEIEDLKKFVEDRVDDWDKKYYEAVELIKKARKDRNEQSEQNIDKQMKQAADDLIANTKKKQKEFPKKSAIMEKVFIEGVMPDTRCSYLFKGDDAPLFPPVEQDTIDFLEDEISEFDSMNIVLIPHFTAPMFSESQQVGKACLYEALSLGIFGTEIFAGVLYKKLLQELETHKEWYKDKTKQIDYEIVSGEAGEIKHKQKTRAMQDDRYVLYVKIIQCKDLIIADEPSNGGLLSFLSKNKVKVGSLVSVKKGCETLEIGRKGRVVEKLKKASWNVKLEPYVEPSEEELSRQIANEIAEEASDDDDTSDDDDDEEDEDLDEETRELLEEEKKKRALARAQKKGERARKMKRTLEERMAQIKALIAKELKDGPQLRSYTTKQLQLEEAVDDSHEGSSDPYVEVYFDKMKKKTKERTKVMYKNLNPVYNQLFKLSFKDLKGDFFEKCPLTVKVKDYDFGKVNGEFMGKLQVPLDDIDIGKVYRGWHEFENKNGDTGNNGSVEIEVYCTTHFSVYGLQLYALANVIRRPIMLKTSQEDVNQNGVGFYGCCGVYPSYRLDSKEVKSKNPIVLAWNNIHHECFVPLTWWTSSDTPYWQVSKPDEEVKDSYAAEAIEVASMAMKDPFRNAKIEVSKYMNGFASNKTAEGWMWQFEQALEDVAKMSEANQDNAARVAYHMKDERVFLPGFSFTDVDVTAEESKGDDAGGDGDGEGGGNWDAMGDLKDEDLFVWLQMNGLGEVDMLDIFLVSAGVNSVSDLLKMSDEDVLEKPEGEKLLAAVKREREKREAQGDQEGGEGGEGGKGDEGGVVHVDKKDVVQTLKAIARGEMEVHTFSKKEQDKIYRTAVVRIQSRYRGNKARHKMEVIHHAATTIQSNWRGRMERRLVLALREAAHEQGVEIPTVTDTDTDTDTATNTGKENAGGTNTNGADPADGPATEGEFEVYTYEDPTGELPSDCNLVITSEGLKILNLDDDEEVVFWEWDQVQTIKGKDDEDEDNLDQLEIDAEDPESGDIVTYAFECEEYRPIVAAAEYCKEN